MKNPDFSKATSEEFFDKTVNIFGKWSKEHLHFGIWNEKTKNYKEAEINTSEYIANCLEIKRSDIILDAGCGVGGTSRYIVANYGVKTVGITISSEQVKRANELSQKIKNRSLLEFQKQDFTNTNFPDESFSKIFALESICYAPDKNIFLNEMYR
ncbi:MAG: Demethylrebeccamycin-D-glucose O-methyltransferase, partial [Candidatus Heimdallarchaeota archaeon LC_3]